MKLMSQEYTTIDELKALLATLSNGVEAEGDNELSDDEDVIELQNILENYLLNKELNTQKELDWQDFCNSLKDYTNKGYSITVKYEDQTIGTISFDWFKDLEEGTLPNELLEKGIINFTPLYEPEE